VLLGDLLGRRVLSGDAELGVVVDARFARGEDGVAELTGFVVGPKQLLALRRLLARRSGGRVFIAWSDVDALGATVTLRPGVGGDPA
jgi:hypothetical protein